jgi:hypothetical protein
MVAERETVIQTILKGWPWILGAAVLAATVIVCSWMATPEVFRTSAELRILPPDEPELWEDKRALANAVDVEGRNVIAVVMGGEVKEAVGRSMGARYGLDLKAPEWQKDWTEVWESRIMVAGPVDGQVFLIVDDEDGERGAELASAVLEALETDWRRRDEALRQEGLDRLDRLIDQDMARLTELVEQISDTGQGSDDPQDLVLAAEREYAAREVAALRLRRSRLESSHPDDPLPWLVVGKPVAFEHHIRESSPLPIILSALAVGWVAWDKGASGRL